MISQKDLALLIIRFREFHSSMESNDSLADQLDSVIATLESYVNRPLVMFLSADVKTLKKFNIVQKGVLYLQPKAILRQAIIDSRSAGAADKMWTNDGMYQHLSSLTSSCIFVNSSLPIIDAFFLRSAAMVPSPQSVLLTGDDRSISPIHPRKSQMDTISGMFDHTIIVAKSPDIAAKYRVRFPTMTQEYSDEMVAFFIAEAKAVTLGVSLEDHLPQVLLEIAARARHLGKSHIRGAVTTGFVWYFFVVDLDDNGAKYWLSEPVEWRYAKNRIAEETSDRHDPALIAGILSSWMLESFTEFSDDQWFVGKLGGGGCAQGCNRLLAKVFRAGVRPF